MIDFIKFDDSVDIKDTTKMNPLLMMILFDIAAYCHENKMPLRVTSMIRTEAKNKALNSKSNTHVYGRAIDISVAGWDTSEIDDLIVHFSKKYEHIGAISNKTGKQNLMYCHNNGNGAHIHIQVRPYLMKGIKDV